MSENPTKQDNSAAVEIGRRLKVMRVERGMMAKDVCEKAGITNSTLTAIENGAYNSGIRQISNIAKALGAHVEIVKNSEGQLGKILQESGRVTDVFKP